MLQYEPLPEIVLVAYKMDAAKLREEFTKLNPHIVAADLLSMNQVAKAFGVSGFAVARWTSVWENFPKPMVAGASVKPPHYAVRLYHKAEILAWLDSLRKAVVPLKGGKSTAEETAEDIARKERAREQRRLRAERERQNKRREKTSNV
jgi:hypothetical protein